MITVLLFYATLFFTSQCFRNASEKDASSIDQIGMEFGPLWLPRSFKITCCLGGQPTPENPQLVRNWTQEVSDYIIDEHYNERTASMEERTVESNCRLFQGSYLLSASALFNFNGLPGIGVMCNCPEAIGGEQLDKSCRRLSPCLNNGYRAFSLNIRCICPEPYFGDYCEKYCDQGQRMKGADGRDYCGCVPFYQGEECREMVCLNGGTEMKQRCLCPPNFLGYHCEIDTNRTSATSRFQRYGDQEIMQGNELFTRDISGTIFSLIMIIVLVVSMYLLMKHRMQVQNRLATLRREDLSRSAHGLGTRRADMISPEDTRILPFRAAPILDGGPPPYVSHPPRGRIRRHEQLPPLPSYEDATKLPPLTRSALFSPTEPLQQRPAVIEITDATAGDQPENDSMVTPPCERRAVEETQPSTSASESIAHTPIFVVERPKIERSSSTRKSI